MIRLWDAASGKFLRALEEHGGLVSLAPLTLDGRPALASGSIDGAIRLWDVASGEQLGRLVVWMGLAQVVAREDMTWLLVSGQGLCAFVSAAALSALAASHGVVRIRRLALDPVYEESFVETGSDAATGELRSAILGPNAWRNFIAVGWEADGRQTVRPIEDRLNAATHGEGEKSCLRA